MNPRLKQNWTINLNVITLREKSRLTQKEFGDKIGIKRQTIASWEEYRSRPTIDQLIKISEAFNVTIDELLMKDLRKTTLRILN